MKKMRKLIAVLLTFAMVMGLGITAFAAETYTLTINNTKEGHTYSIYQIFTGDISGEEDTYVLSNVKYGANYGTQGELVPEAELQAITDADTFAQTVVVTDPAFTTVSSTDGTTVVEGLPAGYYLIKETTTTLPEDDEAYTKHILQVVGDTTIDVKSDVPTVEKKVKEDDKTVTDTTDNRIPDYEVGEGYNDVADYNIGEAVPFKLIGTLPSNYEDYETYKYVFHDTLSAGLAYNGDAKVYADNNGTLTDITSHFTITHENGTLTIACNDLTVIEGVTKDTVIVVEYTATLTSEAEVGLPGNENKVYLEYSNNPNLEGDGTPSDDTGTTPEDKVIVFTYELDVTKIDGKTDATLNGAEFKLLNEDQTKVAVVENGVFKEWVDYNSDEDGTTLVSDENGMFVIKGLDDGTYYLKETKAPVGYNLLDKPVKVVIKATTVNDQEWDGTPSNALTELTITVDDGEAADGNLETGIVETTVKNNAGTTLPETGGIGTTIFYVVGALLVIGAAVLLITKRRMEVE